MPDEALQVIHYTIDPQIDANDKTKHWVWMEKLKQHYTGTTGSSLMTDYFIFWTSTRDHTGLGGTGTSVRNFMCEGR